MDRRQIRTFYDSILKGQISSEQILATPDWQNLRDQMDRSIAHITTIMGDADLFMQLLSHMSEIIDVEDDSGNRPDYYLINSEKEHAVLETLRLYSEKLISKPLATYMQDQVNWYMSMALENLESGQFDLYQKHCDALDAYKCNRYPLMVDATINVPATSLQHYINNTPDAKRFVTSSGVNMLGIVCSSNVSDIEERIGILWHLPLVQTRSTALHFMIANKSQPAEVKTKCIEMLLKFSDASQALSFVDLQGYTPYTLAIARADEALISLLPPQERKDSDQQVLKPLPPNRKCRGKHSTAFEQKFHVLFPVDPLEAAISSGNLDLVKKLAPKFPLSALSSQGKPLIATALHKPDILSWLATTQDVFFTWVQKGDEFKVYRGVHDLPEQKNKNTVFEKTTYTVFQLTIDPKAIKILVQSFLKQMSAVHPDTYIKDYADIVAHIIKGRHDHYTIKNKDWYLSKSGRQIQDSLRELLTKQVPKANVKILVYAIYRDLLELTEDCFKFVNVSKLTQKQLQILVNTRWTPNLWKYITKGPEPALNDEDWVPLAQELRRKKVVLEFQIFDFEDPGFYEKWHEKRFLQFMFDNFRGCFQENSLVQFISDPTLDSYAQLSQSSEIHPSYLARALWTLVRRGDLNNLVPLLQEFDRRYTTPISENQTRTIAPLMHETQVRKAEAASKYLEDTGKFFGELYPYYSKLSAQQMDCLFHVLVIIRCDRIMKRLAMSQNYSTHITIPKYAKACKQALELGQRRSKRTQDWNYLIRTDTPLKDVENFTFQEAQDVHISAAIASNDFSYVEDLAENLLQLCQTKQGRKDFTDFLEQLSCQTIGNTGYGARLQNVFGDSLSSDKSENKVSLLAYMLGLDMIEMVPGLSRVKKYSQYGKDTMHDIFYQQCYFRNITPLRQACHRSFGDLDILELYSSSMDYALYCALEDNNAVQVGLILEQESLTFIRDQCTYISDSASDLRKYNSILMALKTQNPDIVRALISSINQWSESKGIPTLIHSNCWKYAGENCSEEIVAVLTQAGQVMTRKAAYGLESALQRRQWDIIELLASIVNPKGNRVAHCALLAARYDKWSIVARTIDAVAPEGTPDDQRLAIKLFTMICRRSQHKLLDQMLSNFPDGLVVEMIPLMTEDTFQVLFKHWAMGQFSYSIVKPQRNKFFDFFHKALEHNWVSPPLELMPASPIKYCVEDKAGRKISYLEVAAFYGRADHVQKFIENEEDPVSALEYAIFGKVYHKQAGSGNVLKACSFKIKILDKFAYPQIYYEPDYAKTLDICIEKIQTFPKSLLKTIGLFAATQAINKFSDKLGAEDQQTLLKYMMRAYIYRAKYTCHMNPRWSNKLFDNKKIKPVKQESKYYNFSKLYDGEEGKVYNDHMKQQIWTRRKMIEICQKIKGSTLLEAITDIITTFTLTAIAEALGYGNEIMLINAVGYHDLAAIKNLTALGITSSVALHHAAHGGHKSAVKLLLPVCSQAPTSLLTYTDVTPLDIACIRGHVSLVQIFEPTSLGPWQVDSMVKSGHSKAIVFLMQSDMLNSEAKIRVLQDNVLFLARNGKEAALIWIIQNYPDLNYRAKDSDGNNVCHYIALHNMKSLLKYLTNLKELLDQPNNYEFTPYTLCKAFGRTTLEQKFVQDQRLPKWILQLFLNYAFSTGQFTQTDKFIAEMEQDEKFMKAYNTIQETSCRNAYKNEKNEFSQEKFPYVAVKELAYSIKYREVFKMCLILRHTPYLVEYLRMCRDDEEIKAVLDNLINLAIKYENLCAFNVFLTYKLPLDVAHLYSAAAAGKDQICLFIIESYEFYLECENKIIEHPYLSLRDPKSSTLNFTINPVCYTETPDDDIDWYKILSSCCAKGCYRTMDYILLLERFPDNEDFEAALGNSDLKLFLYLMMKTGSYNGKYFDEMATAIKAKLKTILNIWGFHGYEIPEKVMADAPEADNEEKPEIDGADAPEAEIKGIPEEVLQIQIINQLFELNQELIAFSEQRVQPLATYTPNIEAATALIPKALYESDQCIITTDLQPQSDDPLEILRQIVYLRTAAEVQASYLENCKEQIIATLQLGECDNLTPKLSSDTCVINFYATRPIEEWSRCDDLPVQYIQPLIVEFQQSEFDENIRRVLERDCALFRRRKPFPYEIDTQSIPAEDLTCHFAGQFCDAVDTISEMQIPKLSVYSNEPNILINENAENLFSLIGGSLVRARDNRVSEESEWDWASVQVEVDKFSAKYLDEPPTSISDSMLFTIDLDESSGSKVANFYLEAYRMYVQRRTVQIQAIWLYQFFSLTEAMKVEALFSPSALIAHFEKENGLRCVEAIELLFDKEDLYQWGLAVFEALERETHRFITNHIHYILIEPEFADVKGSIETRYEIRNAILVIIPTIPEEFDDTTDYSFEPVNILLQLLTDDQMVKYLSRAHIIENEKIQSEISFTFIGKSRIEQMALYEELQQIDYRLIILDYQQYVEHQRNADFDLPDTYRNSLGFTRLSYSGSEIVYVATVETLDKIPINLQFAVNIESPEISSEDVTRLTERTTYYLERYYSEMTEEIWLKQKTMSVTYSWSPTRIGIDLPKLVIANLEQSRDCVITRSNLQLRWAKVEPVPNLVHMQRLPASSISTLYSATLFDIEKVSIECEFPMDQYCAKALYYLFENVGTTLDSLSRTPSRSSIFVPLSLTEIITSSISRVLFKPTKDISSQQSIDIKDSCLVITGNPDVVFLRREILKHFCEKLISETNVEVKNCQTGQNEDFTEEYTTDDLEALLRIPNLEKSLNLAFYTLPSHLIPDITEFKLEMIRGRGRLTAKQEEGILNVSYFTQCTNESISNFIAEFFKIDFCPLSPLSQNSVLFAPSTCTLSYPHMEDEAKLFDYENPSNSITLSSEEEKEKITNLKLEDQSGWKLLTIGKSYQRLLHFGDSPYMPTMTNQVQTMEKIRLLVTYDDTFNLKRLRDGLCVLCQDDIVFVSNRKNQKALKREFDVIEINQSMALVSFELCRVGRNQIQIQSQRLNRGLKIWTPWNESQIFTNTIDLHLFVGSYFHGPSTKFVDTQSNIRVVDKSIVDHIEFFDIYGNKIPEPNPNFRIELRSKQETCVPEFEDKKDGTYELIWEVQTKGKYFLYIDGKKTESSLSVLAAEPTSHYTYITSDRKVLHVGEALQFMVHLYDKHNNPIERGDLIECGLINEAGIVDPNFPVWITAATQSGTTLQIDDLKVDQSNILRGMLRNPYTAGMADLTIKIKGDDVQDSPYGVLYEPKPPKSFVERIRDFYNIQKYDLPGGNGTMSVRINRPAFIDSVIGIFGELNEVKLRNAISVKFIGEEGQDCGGLTREFYDVLTGTLVNEGYFEEYGDFVRPSQLTTAMNVLYVVGGLYAKGVLHKYSFGLALPISLCKRLKYEQLTPEDFRLDSPALNRSLNKMAEYSPEDLEAADLNFTAERPNGTSKELIPNGENILVNHDNLKDYINRFSMWRMDESNAEQAEIFCQGFRTVLSECLLDFFDPHEWQSLLAGKSDVATLRKNVEYHQCSSTQQIVKWFWTWLETHGDSCVRGFLKFTTGSSVVPVDTTTWIVRLIHDREADRDSLPTAATCFNEIRIPTYSSYNELTRKMNAALIYGSEGFDRA